MDYKEEIEKIAVTASQGLATIKKVRSATPSAIKARLLEFAAGGTVGAATGAGIGRRDTDDKKNKNKNTLKGALLGGLAGGVGAIGLNRLALRGLKRFDREGKKYYSTLNKNMSNAKGDARAFHKDVSNMNTADIGTDKLYTRAYKERMAGRKAGAEAIKKRKSQIKSRLEEEAKLHKRTDTDLSSINLYKKLKAQGKHAEAKELGKQHIRNRMSYKAREAATLRRASKNPKFRMSEPPQSPGTVVKGRIRRARFDSKPGLNEQFEDAMRGGKSGEDMIANRMSNEKNLKTFKEKYIKNGGPKDLEYKSIHDKQKNKAFGGYRGLKDTKGVADKAMAHKKSTQDYLDKVRDKKLQASASGFANSMFTGKAPSGETASFIKGKNYTTADDIKKTKQYADYMHDVKKNVAKDARKGKEGDFFESRYKAQAKKSMNFSDADVSSFKNLIGRSPESIRSKAEYKKVFRNAAKKYHPDIAKGSDKMKDVNKYKDMFDNSEHFDKLSYHVDGIEKMAKGKYNG